MKQTYFETQLAAIDAAIIGAEDRGFEVVIPTTCWADHVAYGTTVKYTLDLVKAGKPQRKALVISLYRMESGKYELTDYIN